MALGSSGGAVIRLFVSRTMVGVVVGVAIGLIGAFAASRLLAPYLFGIRARRSTDVRRRARVADRRRHRGELASGPCRLADEPGGGPPPLIGVSGTTPIPICSDDAGLASLPVGDALASPFDWSPTRASSARGKGIDVLERGAPRPCGARRSRTAFARRSAVTRGVRPSGFGGVRHDPTQASQAARPRSHGEDGRALRHRQTSHRSRHDSDGRDGRCHREAARELAPHGQRPGSDRAPHAAHRRRRARTAHERAVHRSDGAWHRRRDRHRRVRVPVREGKLRVVLRRRAPRLGERRPLPDAGHRAVRRRGDDRGGCEGHPRRPSRSARAASQPCILWLDAASLPYKAMPAVLQRHGGAPGRPHDIDEAPPPRASPT